MILLCWPKIMSVLFEADIFKECGKSPAKKMKFASGPGPHIPSSLVRKPGQRAPCSLQSVVAFATWSFGILEQFYPIS